MSPRVSRRKFLFTGAGIAASGAYLLAQGPRVRIRARTGSSGGGGGSSLTSNDFTYRGVWIGPRSYSIGYPRETYSQGIFGFNGTHFHLLPHANGGSMSGIGWNSGITATKASPPSALFPPSSFTAPITQANADNSGILDSSFLTSLISAGGMASEVSYYDNISANTYNLVNGLGAKAGVVTSVMWDAANSRYLVAYNEHYGNPGSSTGDPCLFAFIPDASGTGFTCEGPWRGTVTSQNCCHHLAPVPAAWQSTYGFRKFFGMAQRRDQFSFAGLSITDFDPPAPGTARDTPTDFGAGASDTHQTFNTRRLSFFEGGVHHQSKAAWMAGGKWYRAMVINPPPGAFVDPPVLQDNVFECTPGDEGAGMALDMWSTFIPIRTTSGKDGILTMGQVCAPIAGANYGTTDGPEAWYHNSTGCGGPTLQGQVPTLGQGCAGPAVTYSANIWALYSPASLAASLTGANLWDLTPYATGRMHQFANNANFMPEQTVPTAQGGGIGINTGMGLFIPASQNPWGSWDAVVIAAQSYKTNGEYDPWPMYHVFEVA